MTVNEGYFNELMEQITNSEKWNMNQFNVFNHEAGTGKSKSTFKILGLMNHDPSNKVLYVQRFKKGNLLDETVKEINDYVGPGKVIAYGFASENNTQSHIKKRLSDYQVICITHKMYIQICKGEHKELIQGRQTLIIDEYPDLLQKVSISRADAADLLWSCTEPALSEIEGMAKMLQNLKDQYLATSWINQLIYLNLNRSEYESYRRSITRAIASIGGNNKKNNDIYRILCKCQHLFKNGGFLHEGGFHTFDETHQYKMLDNNIILDANAGFDYRYALSDKFVVKHQGKMHEYEGQTFHHIKVKTTKTALKKDGNFERDALAKISFGGKRAVLLITEKDRVEKVKEAILHHFRELGYGESLEEIEKNLNCMIKVDYYGHIIGVNDYRDFDTVALFKTPNFDYLTYALTYLYYTSMDNKSIEHVEMYTHEQVENIRKTAIAGEMYQAIKRINRDNSQIADIYVFSDSEGPIDLVLKQLPKIRYVEDTMGMVKQRDSNGSTKVKEDSISSKLQKVLIEVKGNGDAFIKKKELSDRLGKDKRNLSKLLKNEEFFLEMNNMKSEGQKIIFLDNVNDGDEQFISA